MEQTFYELVGRFGLPALFVLTMVEGDITLLLAGVLAHSAFFGEYSFAQVLIVGTLGGVVSDNIAYALGRGTRSSVCQYRFYRAAYPRIQRLTDKFGWLSIFLSKYTYGLRWGACMFYGVAHMPYTRFLLLSLGSCFVWVLALSGAGYFFHTAINTLIGNMRDLSVYLLITVIIIIAVGILGFYLAERYWLSKKIEEADPERIQKLEQAAEEKLHEIKEEIQEHLPLSPARRKEQPKRKEMEGD
jgi:membrane protein DedA with SNARE-associated domain